MFEFKDIIREKPDVGTVILTNTDITSSDKVDYVYGQTLREKKISCISYARHHPLFGIHEKFDVN